MILNIKWMCDQKKKIEFYTTLHTDSGQEFLFVFVLIQLKTSLTNSAQRTGTFGIQILVVLFSFPFKRLCPRFRYRTRWLHSFCRALLKKNKRVFQRTQSAHRLLFETDAQWKVVMSSWKSHGKHDHVLRLKLIFIPVLLTSLISQVALLHRVRGTEWAGRRWASRLWWSFFWLFSFCIGMETLRSSSAWSCSARCSPGTCASSSSSSSLWTSARLVQTTSLNMCD